MNDVIDLGLTLQPTQFDPEQASIVYMEKSQIPKFFDDLNDYSRIKNHEFYDAPCLLIEKSAMKDRSFLISDLNRLECCGLNIFQFSNEDHETLNRYISKVSFEKTRNDPRKNEDHRPMLIFIIGFDLSIRDVEMISHYSNFGNHFIVISNPPYDSDNLAIRYATDYDMTIASFDDGQLKSFNNHKQGKENPIMNKETIKPLDVSIIRTYDIHNKTINTAGFPQEPSKAVITLVATTISTLNVIKPIFPTLRRICDVHNNDKLTVDVMIYQIPPKPFDDSMKINISKLNQDDRPTEYRVSISDPDNDYISCEIISNKNLAEFAIETIVNEIGMLIMADNDNCPEKY